MYLEDQETKVSVSELSSLLVVELSYTRSKRKIRRRTYLLEKGIVETRVSLVASLE